MKKFLLTIVMCMFIHATAFSQDVESRPFGYITTSGSYVNLDGLNLGGIDINFVKMNKFGFNIGLFFNHSNDISYMPINFAPNYTLRMVEKNKFQMYWNTAFGPSFGWYMWSEDIYITRPYNNTVTVTPEAKLKITFDAFLKTGLGMNIGKVHLGVDYYLMAPKWKFGQSGDGIMFSIGYGGAM